MFHICTICGLQYLLQYKKNFHSSQIRLVKTGKGSQSCRKHSERQVRVNGLIFLSENVIKPPSHLDEALMETKNQNGERVNKASIVLSGETSTLFHVGICHRFHDNNKN